MKLRGLIAVAALGLLGNTTQPPTQNIRGAVTSPGNQYEYEATIGIVGDLQNYCSSAVAQEAQDPNNPTDLELAEGPRQLDLLADDVIRARPHFVLQVGDNGDQAGSNIADSSDVDNYLIRPDRWAEYTCLLEHFYNKLDAAGVPWMTTSGNHDSYIDFERAFPRAAFMAKSYAYAAQNEVDRWHVGYTDTEQRAALFTTPIGSICVVSGDYGGQSNATDLTFVHSNVGCGPLYPTIFLSHYGLDWISSSVFTASANSRIVASVYGHETADTIITRVRELTAIGGFKYLDMRQNGQETSLSCGSPGQNELSVHTGTGWWSQMRVLPEQNIIAVQPRSPLFGGEPGPSPCGWVAESFAWTQAPTLCQRYDALMYDCAGGGGPDVTAPTVPASLVATGSSDSSVELTWDASTDAVGVVAYTVRWCIGAACSPTDFLATVPVPDMIATGLPLTGTTYCFDVRAEDAAGNASAYSADACGTTAVDTTPPAATSFFSAIAYSAIVAQLEWNIFYDAGGMDYLQIWRCTGVGCSSFSLAQTIVDPTDISAFDTGLTPETTYGYRIRGIDLSGNVGAYSSTVEITTPEAPASGLVASFTARPIHDATTCVAPCVVHFDAIGRGFLCAIPYGCNETTDDDYSRPFHTHRFAYDFGDATASGMGSTWEHLGGSKNIGLGAIQGHAYYEPGPYTATLTVTSPVGEQATDTAAITVADPNTAFAASVRYCLATDDLDWNGCPLDCAGGDDNCTVIDGSPTFYTALSTGDSCAGSDDCPNIDDQKAWMLLRRGDTFDLTGAPGFFRPFDSAAPGLISAFGTGADPILAQGSSRWEPRSGWTHHNIAFTYSGTPEALLVSDGYSRVSFVGGSVTATGDGSCFRSGFQPTPTTVPYLLAMVDFDCTQTSSTAPTAFWPMARYMVWLGGTVDHNEAVDPGGLIYTMRAFHSQHWHMGHTKWLGAASNGNNWQWRAYDEDANMSAATDDQGASQWNIVADNINENARTSGSDAVCADSGCSCEADEGSCADSGNPASLDIWRRVSDWIFERNFFTRDTQGTTPPLVDAANVNYLLRLTGGSHTLRDNVIDIQGGIRSGWSFPVFAVMGAFDYAADRPPADPPDGDVAVYGNTLFSDDAQSNAITWLAGQSPGGGSPPSTGCPAPCYVYNNLVVHPNATGGSVAGFSGTGSATTGNNVRSTSEAVFRASPPEQGLTLPADFRLSLVDAVARDAGTSLAGGATQAGDRYDALGRCRPWGPWDIGALETAASDCAGREFFVSPTGSNTSAGTIDAPWLTFAFAFTQVGAGDTLWIRSGTWTTPISDVSAEITGGSSWATRLLIAEYPGDTVIIRPTSGENVVRFERAAAQYIELRDLDIDGVNVTGDAVKITYLSSGVGASHIRIRGGAIHDAQDGVDDGVDIENCVLVTGLGGTGEGNEFLDVEVYGCGETANKAHCVYLGTDDNLIDGADIHDCAAAGVSIFDGTAEDPDDNTVRNSEIYNNGTAGPTGEGVEVCGARNSITLNHIHDNQSDGVLTFDDNGTSCDAVDTSIRFNWINANGGGSIVDDATASGTVSTPNVLAAP